MSMEPIFPITALQKKTAAVKDAAQQELVRITENGSGAYVFMSEAVYEHKLQKEIDEAVYHARLADAIERGRADITAGRYTVGTEAFLAKVKKLEAQHA